MESAVTLMAEPSESICVRRASTLLRLTSMSPLSELRRLSCRFSSLVLVLRRVAVSEIFFSVLLLSFLTDSRVRVLAPRFAVDVRLVDCFAGVLLLRRVWAMASADPAASTIASSSATNLRHHLSWISDLKEVLSTVMNVF